MKKLSDFFYDKYFKCKLKDKQYWLDMYLKTYFKEQRQK